MPNIDVPLNPGPIEPTLCYFGLDPFDPNDILKLQLPGKVALGVNKYEVTTYLSSVLVSFDTGYPAEQIRLSFLKINGDGPLTSLVNAGPIDIQDQTTHNYILTFRVKRFFSTTLLAWHSASQAPRATPFTASPLIDVIRGPNQIDTTNPATGAAASYIWYKVMNPITGVRDNFFYPI